MREDLIAYLFCLQRTANLYDAFGFYTTAKGIRSVIADILIETA